MDAKITGSRIAQLRKEKGLTQKQLAEMLFVTDKAVSKWERGLNFPELTLLEPLAHMLDTDMSYLLALENAPSGEAVAAVTEISVQENMYTAAGLRRRSAVKIFIELLLVGAMIGASYIMASHELYGLSQVFTIGMLGFAGNLIGMDIDLYRRLSLLLEKNAGYDVDAELKRLKWIGWVSFAVAATAYGCGMFSGEFNRMSFFGIGYGSSPAAVLCSVVTGVCTMVWILAFAEAVRLTMKRPEKK